MKIVPLMQQFFNSLKYVILISFIYIFCFNLILYSIQTQQQSMQLSQTEVNQIQQQQLQEIEPEQEHEQGVKIDKVQEKLNPKLFTLFRLDGHSFSKFVKKFKMTLPFDEHFTTAMKKTAEECFDYFNFFLGFVGSDEITYAIRPLTEEQIEKKGTLAFNGRVEKMVSLLAGRVSTTFFIELTKLEGFQKTKQFTPHFDCRVFQVATHQQVLQCVSERVKYTLKNSRMMLAQSHFSPKQLHKIPSKKAVELLLQKKAIDYNVVVSADNRVGNVLSYEIGAEEKEIVVKGVAKVINFERKKCILRNLGPQEVMELKQESLC